ncbi:MAG: YlxR family protein [Chloroflexi bacterium]|nr:YlxR family protein [Chloroflexota bacterium]
MRQKHIPQRSCVGCGQVQAKRQMVRVVRTATGQVEVDLTGKKSGRGAYLCKNAECWEKALQKSSLSRALKTEISPEDRDDLLKHGRLFGRESTTQSAPEAEGEAGS